ncbi:MAG: peptidoglycan-binding domain-containing protein [Candidatus Paceibacteria bacterium]
MKPYSKIQKGVVGSMLALSLLTAGVPAPTASANTTVADLQAQITQLLAQLEALRNNTAPTTCLPFTSDLTVGRTGSEVTRLQQYLIAKGHTISAGATGYFGEQTRQALSSYQRSQNITPAVGYFGPVTRSKVNATCVSTPINPGTGTTTPTNPTPQGEASFRDYQFKAGDDTTLEERDENRSIADIEFTVEDGDATLQRIDLVFKPNTANNEKDAWDTFSDVSIWDGNNRIARINTSSKSAWRDINRSTGEATLRISGLNHFLAEDSDTQLTVKVSAANSIRGISDGENWTVYVPNNGIRALDAERTTVEIGNNSEQVEITLEEAGTGDELMIRTSDDDIDATTLVLNRTTRSGFTPVFAFDLDTDDSINDIEINSLPIELSVSTGTMNTLVRDVRIIIDGKTYTRKALVDGTTGIVTFDFKSNELVIDAGDRVTAIVEVDFKALPAMYEGTTISGRVVGSTIKAEGADDLSGNQLSGTVSGDTHILQTAGAAVTIKNTNAVVTSTNGSLNDYATYQISIDVTAINQDVYMPSNTAAISYELRDASGNSLSATGTAVISSSAREQGNYFFIPEGQTRTVTLSVTHQPQSPLTSSRLRLLTLEYAATATNPNQTWTAAPANRFETSVVTIVD